MAEVFAVHILEEEMPEREVVKRFIPAQRLFDIERKRHRESYRHSLVAELLVRHLLSSGTGMALIDIELKYTEEGKPFSIHPSGIRFSLSHSGEWVVCSVSQHETGVDIEKAGSVNLAVADRFFSAETVAILSRSEPELQTQLFYEIWTAAEAYVKFLGKGMFKMNERIDIRKTEDGMKVFDLREEKDDRSIRIDVYNEIAGYILAVCSHAEEPKPALHYLTISEIIIERI